MDAAIVVRGLRVVRGGNVVLPDLSLDIGAGLVTGLLGPSGSGKTTLLRAIVGTQIVAGGDVTVLGLPAGAPPLRRRIGYTTQSASVYGDLSVVENLVYYARILGVSRTRVDAVIERVGLADEANRVVNRLSGGQQARASLASALLHEPELLVLDEPTVGLDPVLRRELWDFFHQLSASGVTLLISSHVMDEADRCDRLLLLREGKLLADETPAELRAATGCDSLDDAFMRLVEGGEAA